MATKRFITSRLILFLCLLSAIPAFGGNPNAKFSVSLRKKVIFSPGNLKRDYKGKFIFADRQYDYAPLYGWGTGNKPGSTSSDDDLYINFYDWGDYMDGNWRTLTKKEWDYLIFKRNGAKSKVGVGNIEGVPGLILLPDKWEAPSGISFNPGFSEFHQNIEDDYLHWSRNTYTAKKWAQMEAAGAVFLPANGLRMGDEVSVGGRRVRNHGYYWSSSEESVYHANEYEFWGYGHKIGDLSKKHGLSVRLVKDAQ